MREENLTQVLCGMRDYVEDRCSTSPEIRAGVGDRLIFRLILTRLKQQLNSAEKELDNDPRAISYTGVGRNIISVCYSDLFSWWDERELRLLKEELGAGR